MKQSKIDAVVAEMEAEKRIVDQCYEMIRTGDTEKPATDVLYQRSEMLAACIARLTGTNNSVGLPMPKPARTRKGRKATEPSL